jgi:hypothetical protein
MLGKAWGKEMHINTIPMFYPTCKYFPLILTLKGVGLIIQIFPLQTQFKGFKENPF